MYNVDSLKHGIEQAKKHIQTFEQAIQREKDTIAEYKKMIKAIEEQEKYTQFINANEIRN